MAFQFSGEQNEPAAPVSSGETVPVAVAQESAFVPTPVTTEPVAVDTVQNSGGVSKIPGIPVSVDAEVVHVDDGCLSITCAISLIAPLRSPGTAGAARV